jgi:N-acetylglucosaminyldiphosphoundecaprenol N-acetyl-beta-D-mannosaminyltransferase
MIEPSANTLDSSPHAVQRRASILGVRIADLPRENLLASLGILAAKRQTAVVTNVNIHAANLSYSLPWFRDFLNSSDITFCDGFGIKLASRLTGQVIMHRNSPPDFVSDLCRDSAAAGARMFFLGGRPGIAEAAALSATASNPGLQVDFHDGYFDKRRHSAENLDVVERINTSKTAILLVGFGMPLQEQWIADNRDALDIGVVMTVGALFDYMTGATRRAPMWMTAHGWEWLGRLAIEPARLWRRYLLGIPVFFWRLIGHHYLGRPLPSGRSER